MKSLRENVIFYDEVSPMCNLYTKAFIHTGMLEKDGRTTYQNMPVDYAAMVDQKRAVNEIALVDKQTGEVTYGVQSLFKILQNSFPFLKPFFKFAPFQWLCDKAYKFISYNRRIIMPAPKEKQYGEASDPSFHASYRLSFLVFTWFVTAFILNRYTQHLEIILPASSFYRELLVCGGQLLWQGLVISLIAPKKAWDYLGNMMTISLAGALLLAIISALAGLFSFSHPILYASAFMMVVGLMLLEHIRRTRLLSIPFILTISWVAYRILLLFILL